MKSLNEGFKDEIKLEEAELEFYGYPIFTEERRGEVMQGFGVWFREAIDSVLKDPKQLPINYRFPTYIITMIHSLYPAAYEQSQSIPLVDYLHLNDALAQGLVELREWRVLPTALLLFIIRVRQALLERPGDTTKVNFLLNSQGDGLLFYRVKVSSKS